MQNSISRLNKIFRFNDIRGIYGRELTEDTVYNVARAMAIFLRCKQCIFGYDMRISSHALSTAFINGLQKQGVDALNIGMVDTPAVYFASGRWKMPAAIITASHNPPHYNGIKLMYAGARPIGENTGLPKIKELVAKANFPQMQRKGKLICKDILIPYKQHILSFVNRKKIEKLNIVIDAGNGMAGKIVPLVYEDLPIHITPLYFTLDGNFPNHMPNPAIYTNVEEARKKVLTKHADFGIAFDGDADRVFFIDEHGSVVSSVAIAGLLINFLRSNYRYGSVIYNVPSGKTISFLAHRYGLKAKMEKVGHTYIKASMRKYRAFFGCEHSGHYYYKKNFYADSGIITSLLVCEIFSEAKRKGLTFSQMLRPFVLYVHAEEKNIASKNKHEIIEKISTHYKKMHPLSIDYLDGETMDFQDWWFNVRPSKSEDFLRINVEAKNEQVLQEKRTQLINNVKKYTSKLSRSHPQL